MNNRPLILSYAATVYIYIYCRPNTLTDSPSDSDDGPTTSCLIKDVSSDSTFFIDNGRS